MNIETNTLNHHCSLEHDGGESLYVAGFRFRERDGRAEVALVTKEKPAWQCGKLNGIGGKVEKGETPEEAMRREFMEEAGVDLQDWFAFCLLHGDGWKVVMFKSHGDADIRTMETEDIRWWPVDELPSREVVANLRWLIPMALSPETPRALVHACQ